MATVTIGYWNFRGIAQNVRLLLSYTNTPFHQVVYDYGNSAQWFQHDKKDIGLEFPNLPYLIDGDFKLTESSSIMKYIIRRSGNTQLLGKDIKDEGIVDNIVGVTNDIFKELRGVLFDPNWAELKIPVFEKIKAKLDYLGNFIGDREFALGYLTFADFVIAEISYFIEALYSENKATYAYWWRIRHNFEKLPGIRAYYQRPNAVSQPFGPASFLRVTPKYKKVIFGYWCVRGLGHTSRLLLGYHGVEFQDVQYSSIDKWFKEEKNNVGLTFPNLPYLIDGQYNITESAAINRYIIQKWGNNNGLLGKDLQDGAKLDSFLAIFTEIFDTIRLTFFNKEYETAKVGIIEKYLPKLQLLNASVGEKEWALGYLTLADFIVSEASHYIERLYPEEYKTLPFLQRIRENFNKLPEIVAYYSNPNAFKGEFLGSYGALKVEKE